MKSCKNLKRLFHKFLLFLTGYHERDNIKVEEVLVNFASKTWLSQPLQFYASNMGWTGTNYQSYDEGYCDLSCGAEGS